MSATARRRPSDYNVSSPLGMRRFMMNLPESGLHISQWRSTRYWAPEVYLCLAALVECVVSVRVKLPPIPPPPRHDESRSRNVALQRHREREDDLAWLAGRDTRPGLTFTHCAQAVYLALGWDEDVLRTYCLARTNTATTREGAGNIWGRTKRAGGHGGRLEVAR